MSSKHQAGIYFMMKRNFVSWWELGLKYTKIIEYSSYMGVGFICYNPARVS